MNNKQYLSCLEFNPSDDPQACVIFLHGLGASADDFKALPAALQLPDDKPVKFIFPNAPTRAVTVNNQIKMPAWFDVPDTSLTNLDWDDIHASIREIHNIVQLQIDLGLPSEHIVIGGFSQGGSIALAAAIQFDEPLAGAIGLSTFLPPVADIQLASENNELPVLLQHGSFDPVLPVDLGYMTRDYLESLQLPVEWQEYPVEHQVSQRQVEAISQWLQALPCFF